ncbi:MAG: putative sugar O-methyltransferase [Gammaproteobacteria bacterium]|nr:putative sugar O-methyltransferase [Gammaproteobacteria bacterium]
MKIIIFSITPKVEKQENSQEGCHVNNGKFMFNDGIEFNASRFGVEVIAYSDFDENISVDNYQKLPLISIETIKSISFDYIILNKTDEVLSRASLNSNGIGDEKILSFDSQRNECISLFQQGTSVCIREHAIEGEVQLSTSTCFSVNRLVTESIPNSDEYKTRREVTVQEVFEAYKSAKNSTEHNKKDSQVGENWFEFLKRTRPEFYDVMKNNDLIKLGELLDNFYRNEMSTGILGGEDGFKQYINANNFIANFRNLFNTWKNSVEDKKLSKVACPEVGNPYGVLLEEHIIHPNNFLNHYRSEFTSNLLSDFPKSVVVEVGGGYGGYAHSLFQTDFDGVYINFDLPENLIVSSYFLKTLYPHKKILCYNRDIQKIDDVLLSEYDMILMPHYMVETMADKSAELCINTISFSEMDYDNIQYYISHFSRISKKYIYHENMLDGGAGYKFFSESTFPKFKKFKKIFSVPSRWSWFNLNSPMHHHGEFLLERVNEGGE